MYTVKEFNSRDAFQDYLNGAVLGKPLEKLTFGLHGKTLAITPSGGGKVTVTFADADGKGLSASAILAAITAASNKALLGKVALRNYGFTNSQNPQLAVTEIGAVLDGAGTANEIFGLPKTNTTIAEVSTTNVMTVVVNPTGPLYTLILHR